jgi:hypothetical protein
MTFPSGFPLTAFAGGGPTVTGGPPRVAIFVEAASISGEGCVPICSGTGGSVATGAASLAREKICAGGRACPVDATFVSASVAAIFGASVACASDCADVA